jgi:hypothetical protein
VKSWRAPRFRELFRDLPIDIKGLAYDAYRTFKRDPFDPRLRFKCVNKKDSLWSARVGRGYRALGVREKDDEIIWIWIGPHREYEKILADPKKGPPV